MAGVGAGAVLDAAGGPARRMPRTRAFRAGLAAAGAMVAALGLVLVLAGGGGLLAAACGLAGGLASAA